MGYIKEPIFVNNHEPFIIVPAFPNRTYNDFIQGKENNFERDENSSKCINCKWRYSEKCSVCRFRYSSPTLLNYSIKKVKELMKNNKDGKK